MKKKPNDLQDLYEFYDPVEPVLLMFEVPGPMQDVCRELAGQALPLQEAVDRLQQASGGLGTVATEDGYISWELVEQSSRALEALARLFELDGMFDGEECRQVGLMYDAERGTAGSLSIADLYYMVCKAEQAPRPGARHFAALIRFRPVSAVVAH